MLQRDDNFHSLAPSAGRDAIGQGSPLSASSSSVMPANPRTATPARVQIHSHRGHQNPRPVLVQRSARHRSQLARRGLREGPDFTGVPGVLLLQFVCRTLESVYQGYFSHGAPFPESTLEKLVGHDRVHCDARRCFPRGPLRRVRREVFQQFMTTAVASSRWRISETICRAPGVRAPPAVDSLERVLHRACPLWRPAGPGRRS